MTNKKTLILLLAMICIIALLYFICESKDSNEEPYNVEIFKSGAGWGYQIKKNEKVIILQSYIPCIKGNKPFPDEESALHTGKLVLAKINNQEDPTITIDELSTIIEIIDQDKSSPN